MAYKDMSTTYYVVLVLLFYGSQVGVSLLVDDISIMFDFVSAFAVSFYAFIFPAIFYELAAKKYGGAVSYDHCWARSFFFVGIINCGLGLYSAINGIIDHE
jgi:tellurite resistance protein TehA-like permease